MTDAEKQAIDNFRFFNEGEYITKEMEESKETVLNLIEKQQRIIEGQKSRCSHLGRDVQKAVDYTFELNKEIENKDKIIDRMADFMWDYDCCSNFPQEYCKDCCDLGQGKQCIKEYFKKKVETEEK